MRKKDAVVTGKEDVSDGDIKLVLEHKGLPYEEFMQMMSESGRKLGMDVREDPFGMDFLRSMWILLR